VTKRVLIVDDEPIVITVLRAFFFSFRHPHAYEITSAYAVADADDLLHRERFDLILLDLVVPQIGDRLPWTQGLDLLKRIRARGVTSPVLMMSGAWDTQNEAEALRAGAVACLRKPFELHDLDRVVTSALATASG
jgi:CheY-like chemotaxis protein